MRALDLFCGAGGASMGLHQAGYEVTGIDIKPQPRYPFTFIQGDATKPPVRLEDFDFIWASPPCQAHTSLKSMWNARDDHPDLIPATRALLEACGKPWAMENVPGAPLRDFITLCGTMFGLSVNDAELRRHRIFETCRPIIAPRCNHNGRTIGIYGEGCRDSRRKFDKTIPEFGVKHGRLAMGIDWMSLAELCQAIPPAYSNFIARQLAAS